MTTQHGAQLLADNTAAPAAIAPAAPDSAIENRLLDAIDTAHGIVSHAVDSAFAAARTATTIDDEDGDILDVMDGTSILVAHLAGALLTWAQHLGLYVQAAPAATTPAATMADLAHVFDSLRDQVPAARSGTSDPDALAS